MSHSFPKVMDLGRSGEQNMASTSSSAHLAAHVLMKKGKRGAATYVYSECVNSTHLQILNELLDIILCPGKAIDEWETIDWCKWLMAGGRTPDDFSTTVLCYDNATTCGLVWTANFVAYRCRTCGISPCMSLCAECFKKGNHTDHDFNMFRSQAGGACDCGDTSVMQETGFCDRHGPRAQENKPSAPRDLMCVAEAMMPRIILRLIQHLREHSNTQAADSVLNAIKDADAFLTMLLDFSAMGAAMRRVMTGALTNPQVYKNMTEHQVGDSEFMRESKRVYEEAVKSLPNPEPPDEYKDCPSLQEQLIHCTFLEELVFWTVKFEFPQKMVCLLLNMLPDPDYKEALTQAFVLHYSRISMMLEKSSDPDALSNRVVHVSVQLFSNEGLAFRMCERLNLLHVMVISLKYMMSKILIQNTLHDPDKNFHYVVDCARQVMKEHCYWPLVSDLNNVLSHKAVALKFMSDDNLLEMWFAFLAMFQGMNVNQREVFQHVEFEPNTYYAAFSAELEASAYPMGSMVSHLSDPSFVGYTKRVLASCLTALQDWLDAINFTDPSVGDTFQVSFHLPLHRYFSVFMCQAIKHQGMALRDILPSPDILHLMMMHPLRVQVAFYEILSGMWVRNGLQIKGQAMTYIQCNFCNSMVDADIYLLQVCATQLSAHTFLDTVADKFHIKEWMSMTPYITNTFLEGEHDTAMLESFLTFLATLMSVRTNLGLSDVALRQLEIVTLLCMGDKTHSQLLELMPESRGNYQGRDFESELSEVADYTEPNCEASGNMQHGMYSPKAHIWEHMYDPIHVLLRAVHRRDFQSSMDHFTEYARHSNQVRSGSTPWPPFRIPSPCSEAYEDPRKLLCSRTFHAMAFAILFRAVRTQNVPEQALSLVIFLLEMAVDIAEPNTSGMQVCQNFRLEPKEHADLDFSNWFESDWLSANLRTVIDCVTVRGETRPSAEPWESSGSGTTEGEVLTPSSEGHGSLLMLEEGETEPIPQDPEDQSAAAGNALALPRIPITLLVNNAGPAILAQLMPSSSQGVVATTSAGGSGSVAGPSTSMPSTSGRHRSQEPSINEAASSSSSNQCTAMVPSMVATDSEDQASLRRRAYTNLGGGTTYHMAVCVGESLISLLLKLHSNLSGAPDSFELDEPPNPPVQGGAPHPASESRVGDGPFFVAKLLHRIAKLDPMCREAIIQTKERLWPKREEEKDEEREAREAREREERRRRAKERQQRLMAEFANRQKQFMEKARETEEEGGGMDWSDVESPMISKKEYDCVICNQSTPSTDEKPMGLVVLLQATSILGHKRLTPEPPVLPTSEEEKLALRRDDCLASEFDKRVEELNRQFDNGSWLLSVNLGWEGGVHVQTCGHHLHLDCLKSYLHSLRSQQRQQSLAVERGEYSCPLCRQLANSVLPLSPQLGECAALARSRPASMVSMVSELSNLLKDNPPVPTNSNLMEAMGKSMEDMTNTTSTRYKHQHGTPSSQCLFLFVSSIARTNLEVEVVQRGGSIVSPRPDDAAALALIPKRSCIVPLLHVLAMHARVLTTWPAWLTWLQAAGVSSVSTPGAQAALSPYEREVPLLLKEPSTLLTHFLLQLPLHLEQTYFSCVVKVLYNVLYFQALAQLSCRLSESGRAQWCTQGQEEGGRSLDTLEACMALLVTSLEPGQLYLEEATGWDGQGGSGDHKQLENDLQTMCLPFLRIAALLRHHLYGEELPEIRSEQAEFVRLVYYLELVTEGMDWRRFNAAVALNWPWRDASSSSMTGSTSQLGVEPQTPEGVVKTWCAELLAFAHRSQSAARSLVAQHNRWHQPRLLRLPHLYDKLFQFYHRRQCSQCHSVPRETSVCLLCGAVVCLKENCCKQQNVCEAVQHSMDCGAGTAMYLVVTSSYIIVIRGKRACLWGSVYLDSFGEEDRDLKRGKPLYLSPGRYQLLEQQWLSHRFDHTNKKWVWHREAL